MKKKFDNYKSKKHNFESKKPIQLDESSAVIDLEMKSKDTLDNDQVRFMHTEQSFNQNDG